VVEVVQLVQACDERKVARQVLELLVLVAVQVRALEGADDQALLPVHDVVAAQVVLPGVAAAAAAAVVASGSSSSISSTQPGGARSLHRGGSSTAATVMRAALVEAVRSSSVP